MREAVKVEDPLQGGLDVGSVNRRAGAQSQGVTRVVIDQSEGVTAPLAQGEVTFKVHLPKVIRMLVTEALIGRLSLGIGAHLQALAAQDRRDGADRRTISFGQQRPQLARSPARVAPMQSADLAFQRSRAAPRPMLRRALSVGEAILSLGFKPRTPLVSRRRTDPETTAQLAYISPRLKS